MTWDAAARSMLCACWVACACDPRDSVEKDERSQATAVPRAVEASVPTPVVAPSSGGTSLEPQGAPGELPRVMDVTACNRLPFFDFYRNARLITLDEPTQVRLQLHINYHTGAGCMAPDGYGTDLILTLRLRAEDTGCFLEQAQVRAVDWGLPQDEGPDASDRKLRFDFTPFDVLERVDLTSSAVAAVAIHNPQYAVSALIRRTGVLWYEQTRRDSVLHTSVDTQGEETGCCWPATSTYYREHGVFD